MSTTELTGRRLRRMTHGDLERVLAWRNHQDVRRYMYTQHEISLAEHTSWFERASRDDSRHLLVFEIEGVPLGFIACSFFNMLPVIGTYLSFHPSFGIVLPSITGAFLLSVVGSLYPAWRAVSMTPADALRRA